MSQRLFLLLQDRVEVVSKTAFRHEDCFSNSTLDILTIWIIVSNIVLVIGFFFAQAINHKKAKTDWEKFIIYYGILCAVSFFIYLIIHE